MIEDSFNKITMRERLQLKSYEMLYRNVRNRLCRQVEVISFDFLLSQHEGGAYYLQQYKSQPRQYICRTHVGGFVNAVVENHYLVVAGQEHVALLREPGQALARKQPFLLVFDGKAFQPQDCNAVDFWQKYIEPTIQERSNVLSGVDDRFNFTPSSFPGMIQKNQQSLRQWH